MATHKHQEMMREWAEGKIIQFRLDGEDGIWESSQPFEVLSWHEYTEYRVKPVDTYKIGQWYCNKETGEYYVLCAVTWKQASLFCVDTGCRWNDPVTVASLNNITEDEFKAITLFEHERFIPVDTPNIYSLF